MKKITSNLFGEILKRDVIAYIQTILNVGIALSDLVWYSYLLDQFREEKNLFRG